MVMSYVKEDTCDVALAVSPALSQAVSENSADGQTDPTHCFCKGVSGCGPACYSACIKERLSSK